MRIIGLGIALLCFWFLLSGHFSLEHPLLLVFAGMAIAFCLYMGVRMMIIDEEGVPVHLIPRALTYFPWLIVEIFKSAVHVTKVILSPSLPIAPSMFDVEASQKTRSGVNIYCNSITLTPGTITVGVKDNTLHVHALTTTTAEDLKSGGMDARVTQYEGAK